MIALLNVDVVLRDDPVHDVLGREGQEAEPPRLLLLLIHNAVLVQRTWRYETM